MSDLALAGNFEQVEMADQIGLSISMRVFDGISNPGLRAQMDDTVYFLAFKRSRQRFSVGKIALLKSKSAIIRGNGSQPVALQLNIIIIVEVVDTDNVFAPRKQAGRHMKADKSRNSGYQYCHVLLSDK